MSGLSVSDTEHPLHNMTAINRYAKICQWLNKRIILVTAAIAAFVSFAVPLLR
jgi:hypothetical protein